MHPVLKEVGLTDVPEQPKKKKQTKGTTCSSNNCNFVSALDILQQLLETNVVTEDHVRAAHAFIITHKSNNDNDDNNNVNNRVGTIETHKAVHSSCDKPFLSSDAVISKQPPAADYRTRHIALRVYYEGKRYSGLAQNVGIESDQSVERQLFAALLKTRLIQSRETCQYSRCGRTDKGVSAVGQVIALQLKSAIPIHASWDEHGKQIITQNHHDNDEQEDDGIIMLPKNSHDKITVWVPPNDKRNNKNKSKIKNKNNKPQLKTPINTNDTGDHPQTEQEVAATATVSEKRQCKELSEYSYERMLNSLLPPDIRILGWCPVSKDFSARFSASTRTYRYFFLARNLDLQAMQQGLERLVGTHDFRNFCKLNVVEVSNFVRTIHDAQLVVIDDDDNSSGVCFFQIQGQAFLWHQIRCIVSILFLIGRGLETPSVVSELLDIQLHPGKPSYPLAPEFPLVLHGCGYPNLQIGFSVPNLWMVTCQLEEQWENLMLEAARVRNCLEMLAGVNTIRKQELVLFATSRLLERHKKQQRGNVKAATTSASSDEGQWMEFVKIVEKEEQVEPGHGHEENGSTAQPAQMDWKQAMEWLARWKLVPDASGLRDHVHIPLLARSKGTTYEEKIDALQQSTTRRSQRYEENVAKKRKMEGGGDADFYEHMLKQGGSAV
jgi:tRNA pseudouridine(38-40) synthase